MLRSPQAAYKQARIVRARQEKSGGDAAKTSFRRPSSFPVRQSFPVLRLVRPSFNEGGSLHPFSLFAPLSLTNTFPSNRVKVSQSKKGGLTAKNPVPLIAACAWLLKDPPGPLSRQTGLRIHGVFAKRTHLLGCRSIFLSYCASAS
jgi:hypothetical protein